MKKLVTLIIIAVAVIGLHAQEGATAVVLLNYNTVKKKVGKSDADIQDPKKNTKAATWEKRGELYQDVFMIGLEQLQEGMDATTVTLFYKEPVNIETETKEGALYEKHVYEHMIYTFVNGALQEWQRKDPIHPDPLRVAMDAYIKALELDEKNKLGDNIKENLIELKNQLKRDGVNYYYSDGYDKALESFENVLEINNMDLFAGEMDTIMVQYSGIISREIAGKTENNDLYKKAIKYYEQLAEADYGGPNTYLQIKMDYMTIGDTLKALDVLKEAYAKYPDTINVIANIADTYVLMKQFDEGIEFMGTVIEANPDIPEAYYWNGRLLINKEEVEFIDKAIESYEKAGELDPSIYYVWYDLGYIYYLQGADFYDRSNTEEHEPTRDQLLELGKEKYTEAIPALEKAYELNEENATVKFETLDLLQRIYYKEQMMDQYDRVKELKANM
ncbi:MAG: tetratricopeptide repeat protein [Bacteroidales bacterium]|nr:tetratricopeptide repeat protein [Bacteroidales bacterium]